jgi:hypothetical protein
MQVCNQPKANYVLLTYVEAWTTGACKAPVVQQYCMLARIARSCDCSFVAARTYVVVVDDGGPPTAELEKASEGGPAGSERWLHVCAALVR